MLAIKESLFVNIIVILCLNAVIITTKEYKFVAQKWEKVLEEEEFISSDLTYERNGDDIIFNGQLKQLVDIDNDWQMKVVIERELESEDGDKYVPIFSFPPKGVCEFMSTHYKHHFYESLKQHSNAPDPDKCPVTSETYTVDNYKFDTTTMRKHMHPGKYIIRLNLLKDKETKAEYILVGEVVDE